MPDPWPRVALFPLGPMVFALLVAPLAAHLALLTDRLVPVAGGLIVAQTVLVTWFASSSLTSRVLRGEACLLVLLGTLIVWRFADGGPVAASAVPHAMAYMGMLAVFAASLQPGREAVVTGLARRSRGQLSPEILRYTRRVTWAWCWFFTGQLAVSLILMVFAPLQAWSVFVNLGNLPLIGIMAGAEYGYRRWRHPTPHSEGLADMVRSFRRIRTAERAPFDRGQLKARPVGGDR